MKTGGTEEMTQGFVVSAVCPTNIGSREGDRYTFSFMLQILLRLVHHFVSLPVSGPTASTRGGHISPLFRTVCAVHTSFVINSKYKISPLF